MAIHCRLCVSERMHSRQCCVLTKGFVYTGLQNRNFGNIMVTIQTGSPGTDRSFRFVVAYLEGRGLHGQCEYKENR